MFLDYYGLVEQPFGETPDPRFLYQGVQHRAALAALTYGTECNRGFLTLIAQPGMGKTSLLFRYLEGLRGKARTAFVFQTDGDAGDLKRYVFADLGLDIKGKDLPEIHSLLNQVLVEEMRAGRRFVLVIDEAQNLDERSLESVRLLSNFETSWTKLMQIVIAGQPHLAERLALPSMAQLRQRISFVIRIDPFNSDEVNDYINHRLAIAGYKGSPLFTAGARQLITEQSSGIPRNINNICFNAMSLGWALKQKTIDRDLIREVSADFDLESLISAYRHSNTGKATVPRPHAAVVALNETETPDKKQTTRTSPVAQPSLVVPEPVVTAAPPLSDKSAIQPRSQPSMWRESAVQALGQALARSRVRLQGSVGGLKNVRLAGTGVTLLTSLVVGVIMFGRLAKPAHQAMSAPRNMTSEILVGKPPGTAFAAASSTPSSEGLSTKPATARSHAEGSKITSVPEGTAGRSKITIGEIAHPTLKTAVRLTSSDAPALVVAPPNDFFIDRTNGMFQNVVSEPEPPEVNRDHQIQGPKVVSSPPLIYPSQARMEKIQGVVVIDALVDPMGKVADTKVISGPAGLVQAAVDSLHAWRYQPALLHGQPIAMHVRVNINFNLR